MTDLIPQFLRQIYANDHGKYSIFTVGCQSLKHWRWATNAKGSDVSSLSEVITDEKGETKCILFCLASGRPSCKPSCQYPLLNY